MEKYVAENRTICLCVVPVNVDPVTVESFKIADQYDPFHKRTIGVITKVDLIDPGTERTVLNLLENKIKPLELGYVAVKNRGDKDILNKMSLAEAKKREANFFIENIFHGRALRE